MANCKEMGSGTEPEIVKKLQLNKSDTNALKDLLQKRLDDCGWRKDVRQRIRKVLEERGLNNITYDQLAAEIVPQARALVPEAIRKEMSLRVRASLEPTIKND